MGKTNNDTKQPLTIKEKKLVKGVAAGKTKRQAARDAGYVGSDEVVSVTASQTLSKPNVKEALELTLVKHGITLDAAVAPIADALKADKVHIVGNGDQAMAEIVPDHSIRLKASGMALNLMGANKQEGSININFINQVQEKRDLYDL